ncbi:hypothetical protein ACFPAF_16835 [Hymenobacter endophyticus]|uniref:Uncharacterized protein n=1 Tax=Hymenobacter endophyticus TaxID=3076335 RepID=A0ABU3TL25_9BACT|nr:hypothetical protein [Hymenobacter endophyticus]MDU0372070.1 hypothetical protein [Hymenobacter endophyticus]
MVLINLTDQPLNFWFNRKNGEALPLNFELVLPFVLEEEAQDWGWHRLELPAGHFTMGAGASDEPALEPSMFAGVRGQWPEMNDPYVYALPHGRFVQVRTQEPRHERDPYSFLRAFELIPSHPPMPLLELPAEVQLPTRPAQADESLPAEALGVEPYCTFVKATFTTYTHREEVTLELPLDFYSMPQIQQEVLLDEEYDAWLLGGRTTYTIHEPQAAA